MPVLAYARLLGYVIAEGHTRIPPKGSGAYVGITQCEGPVLNDIRTTLDSLGLSWWEYSRSAQTEDSHAARQRRPGLRAAH